MLIFDSNAFKPSDISLLVRGEAEISYGKHLTCFLNGILAHLHDARSDSMSPWCLQWFPSVLVYIIEQSPKCRMLDLIEWLVTGDNPLGEQILELILVPVYLYLNGQL
jgi:hypothetical protein